MAGAGAVLAIRIIADASQAARELGKTGKDVGAFEKGIKSAAVPAAAVVAGLGAMTLAASEDAAEQAMLVRAYKSAGAATGDYTKDIDAAIAAGQDKAFTDSDVRAGLKPLVAVTKDAAKANELLGPAMDLARYAGVDLETASTALAKAHAGSATQLARMVPALGKVEDPMKAIAQATALAAGAAETYAAAGPGQIFAVADAFGELGESVGTVFLPALSEVTRLAKDLAGFLQENLDVVQPLAVAVGALAVALLAANVALGIMALLASPLTLVFLAIAAIGAGLIILYTKSETFRNIVDGAIRTVIDVFTELGRIVGEVSEAIPRAWQAAVDKIRGVFEGVQTTVENVFSNVKSAIRNAVDVVAGIFEKVGEVLETPIRLFGKVVDIVFAAARLVVSLAILAIRTIFSTILDFLRVPWELFRGIVTAVFLAVRQAVTDALAIIRGLFATIGAWLQAPWLAFQKIVQTVMSAVRTAVSNAIVGIKGIFSTLLAALRQPWDSFLGIVQRVMDGVVNAVRNAVRTIENILDNIRGAIQSVQNAVDRVTPGKVAPAGAAAGRGVLIPTAWARGRRAPGAGGGGGSFTVNVYGGDPWKVEQAVARAYRRWTANSGSTAPTRAW